MDHAGVLHLFGGQILLVVVLELLGEDQQAIQRRAQLVGHVGEELRLVPRRDRQLLGLLLQQAFGELDVLVLAFHLDVLLGQAAGLLVGAAQLLLARLKLLRLGLGLFKQRLGEGVGLDRVEHESEALGQLIEERLVGRAETADRGQLHHRPDRPLEQDRQDDDVHRRAIAKTRVDPDVVAGDVGQQNALLFLRALSDQPLAEPEVAREVFALLITVAGLIAQDRFALVGQAGEQVEDTVLG
jgi:hypothetical protein